MDFYEITKKDWKKEAEICLDYVLNKIQKEYRNIKINSLTKAKILNDYYNFCATFHNSYIKGNLDSFEKAACLMTAIHRNKILFYGDNQNLDIGKVMFFPRKKVNELGYISSRELKSQLALEAALKMCENPICYVGRNFDELKQLEKFNLPKFIDKYSEEWEGLKKELLVSSLYSEGKYSETVYKYLMLKYLYQYINSKSNENNTELMMEEQHGFQKIKKKQ